MDRRLPPLDAHQALLAFELQFGRAALSLLQHVAVLEEFRADLVALIRARFLTGHSQANSALDAAVLFGPLSQDLTCDLYRIDREVRVQCLRRLDQRGPDGSGVFRSQEVARFVFRHLSDSRNVEACRNDTRLEAYLTKNRWSAHALLEPDAAVTALLSEMALSADSLRTGGSRPVRFGALATILETVVPRLVPVMAQARALDSIVDSDFDSARRLLSTVPTLSLGAHGQSFDSATLRELVEHRERARPQELPVAAHGAALSTTFVPGDVGASDIGAGQQEDGPLVVALQAGDVDGAERILSAHGADLDKPGRDGRHPFHLAAEAGSTELALLLLRSDHSVHSQDRAGNTPLQLAAANGRHAVVELLLQSGGMPDSPNQHGHTPLMAAARNGHEQVVVLLLRAGANVNAKTSDLRSALFWAIAEKRRRIAWRLLDCEGVSVRGSDAWGWTLTHVAAYSGLTDILAELARLGAPVAQRSLEGFTALSLACSWGHHDVVEALLNLAVRLNDLRREEPLAIQVAASHGHARCVRVLERYGANVRAVDERGLMPIHLAARKGKTDTVKAIVELAPDSLGTVTPGGYTAFHLACWYGHVDLVDALLSLGIDPSQPNAQSNESPMSMAVRSENRATVRLLLAHPAVEVDGQQDKHGSAPVQRAATLGLAGVLEELLSSPRVTRTVLTHKGESLLHLSACAGHVDATQVLINHDFDLEATTETGDTVLGAVAATNHGPVVRALLDGGASPNRRSGSAQMTPLGIACNEGKAKAVEALIAYGVDLEATDRNSQRPLSLAAAKGSLDIVTQLLEAGATVDSRCGSLSRTSLASACDAGHAEVVAALLGGGASAEEADAIGDVPLTLAAAKDADYIIDLLLAHNARVDRQGGWRSRTAITAAVEGRAAKAFAALRRAGADPRIGDAFGNSCLHSAARAGFDDAVSALIDDGLDVDARNGRGETCLHLAADQNHVRAVNALITAKADITATDHCGHTPLHRAVMAPAEESLVALLAAGADASARDRLGWTPLHVAAQRCDVACVRHLLTASADPNAVLNERRMTPLDVALEAGAGTDVIDALRAAGGHLGVAAQT